MEINMFKTEVRACYQTIHQLRQQIHLLEKRIELLSRQTTDHRFIHELFYLCLRNPPSSFPSHHQMKTYIQQIFHHFIRNSSNYTCKCSDSTKSEHYPNYEFCLQFIEAYQKLFNLKCFKQIPNSLTDFYQKYSELKNFLHSISNTIGIENQNEKLVIHTLKELVEDSKSDKLDTFKRLAKVKDMNEAIRKVQSYDNFVPHYHHFIDQLMDLLEVSKSDQIIPAIKTLKLLAHYDMKLNSS